MPSCNFQKEKKIRNFFFVGNVIFFKKFLLVHKNVFVKKNAEFFCLAGKFKKTSTHFPNCSCSSNSFPKLQLQFNRSFYKLIIV